MRINFKIGFVSTLAALFCSSATIAYQSSQQPTSFTQNIIDTADLESKSFGQISRPTISQFKPQPQVVYLNFDDGGAPTFPVIDEVTGNIRNFIDHIYTDDERNQIQQRIEEDYSKFNFVFTQDIPSEENFLTLNFGGNDRQLITINSETGNSRVRFGQVDPSDLNFRNIQANGSAFIDSSFWEYLAQVDPTGLTFSNESSIPLTVPLQEAVSLVVVNQSANTASHELGHLLGLEHQDSYGPPGTGIPEIIDPITFIPAFDGPMEAVETTSHIMSTSSTGTNRAKSATVNRFFSERSALKLSYVGKNIIEENQQSTEAGQYLFLRSRNVPNTIDNGQNKNSILLSRTEVISGSITDETDEDTYSFTAQTGDIVNIEVYSVRLNRLGNSVISELELFKQSFDGTLTKITSNIQSTDTIFDAKIFDFPIPSTGRYVVKIKSRDFFFFDTDGDGLLNNKIFLDDINASGFKAGNYELLIYIFNPENLSRFKRPA